MIFSRARRAAWSSGEKLLCGLWLGSIAGGCWLALNRGFPVNQLALILLLGSVLVLGLHDTRHNQPTHYNLMRSWPFGSASDDELRGRQTVSSQALHALMALSLCLCVLRIAFMHP
jgi:hypothetical protein